MIERVIFNCGDIKLEGVEHIPEANAPFPAAIICHPHPRFGGNMDNNVVTSLAEKILSLNFLSLRFNFRGVGGSSGESTGGEEEDKDVLAAYNFLLLNEEVDKEKIFLIGYSFGSYMAARVFIKEKGFKGLILISPPLNFFNFAILKNEKRSKFLICGNHDMFISLNKFNKLYSGIAEPKAYKIIPGADHFWLGREEELADEVAKFLERDNSIRRL